MSTMIDPAKLKVVELRAELSARGLDTKGNKPVLVKRLKDALEQEMEQELPDTSIADTSTEDLDSSQNKEETAADVIQVAESSPKPDEAVHQPMEIEPMKVKVDDEEPSDEVNGQKQDDKQEETKPEEKECPETIELLENGDNAEQNEDAAEPKNRKSRWGAVPDVEEQAQTQVPEDEVVDAKTSEPSEEQVKEQSETSTEQRGDKRKRSSPSPERSQRRRSKSPIQEDEPPIDQEKVQLSWYDSDLHLQVDKETFLSARPYHEGAFGYAWAGVRATHGVSSGKVCFEVKITEELKWEDIIRQIDRNGKDRDKHRKYDTTHMSEKKKEDSDQPAKDKNQDDENPAEAAEKPEESAEKTEESAEKPEESAEKTEESVEEESQKPSMQVEGEAKQNVQQEENSTGEEQKQENKDEAAEKMDVEEVKESEPICSHMFRVGWSLPSTGLQLGEFKYSYGYESTGKFVTEKQFQDYGISFGVGDVIGSYVDIDSENVSITFTVNGVLQPTAIVVPRTDFPEDGFALFPHVLSRNYAFELNLGSKEEPWFANPETLDDFVYLEKVEEKIPGPVRPETRSECEVIMMCGLPASGKTHWVRQWVEKNPEKRYTVIGNTQLLEKMTVNGNPLKNSYKNRWNVVLDKLQKCLYRLVEAAALRRRNYVIDQTNVFSSVQRRKMRPFEGFKRRAVVVVVSDEEQAKRQALQEEQDGKDVPNSAVLEMKANMSIPRVSEWIEEVEFAELGEEEAKAIVQKYNTQGREAGFGNSSYGYRRDNRNNRPQRWQNNRRDYRSGGYRDSRGYMSNQYERGPRHGGWQRPRSGSWNRNDYRDARGPPSRDWRNSGGSSGRSQDRGHDRNRAQGGSYNRNRSGGGGRPQGGNWQGSGSYGQGGWSQSGGSWGQGQGSWGQGGQGSWGQNQSSWKHGQGYNQNYGSYPNYYYGQYPQNWSGSQQAQHQTGGTAANNTGMQYDQSTQNMWVQYAQQYAQGAASTQQETPQK